MTAKRESELDLSRMRDIGGCRVVLAHDDLSDLYRLRDWAGSKWEECKVIDYIQKPRRSGYRAIHLIVKQDGDSVVQEFLRLRTLLEDTPEDEHNAMDVNAYAALTEKVRTIADGIVNRTEEVNDE